MGKVVFIMDKPSCCGECEMSGTGICRKWNMKDLKTFPKECPLKEIPKYKDINPDPYFVGLTDSYNSGYNACISEILKECD